MSVNTRKFLEEVLADLIGSDKPKCVLRSPRLWSREKGSAPTCPLTAGGRGFFLPFIASGVGGPRAGGSAPRTALVNTALVAGKFSQSEAALEGPPLPSPRAQPPEEPGGVGSGGRFRGDPGGRPPASAPPAPCRVGGGREAQRRGCIRFPGGFGGSRRWKAAPLALWLPRPPEPVPPPATPSWDTAPSLLPSHPSSRVTSPDPGHLTPTLGHQPSGTPAPCPSPLPDTAPPGIPSSTPGHWTPTLAYWVPFLTPPRTPSLPTTLSCPGTVPPWWDTESPPWGTGYFGDTAPQPPPTQLPPPCPTPNASPQNTIPPTLDTSPGIPASHPRTKVPWDTVPRLPHHLLDTIPNCPHPQDIVPSSNTSNLPPPPTPALSLSLSLSHTHTHTHTHTHCPRHTPDHRHPLRLPSPTVQGPAFRDPICPLRRLGSQPPGQWTTLSLHVFLIFFPPVYFCEPVACPPDRMV
ncbi:extensin-like [Felis catus]|uniref:extensin-like n=1 Tax=Felis catus TaxID=9685 RepID=UPI001D1A0767|nr:extensin-like [Felis catus]